MKQARLASIAAALLAISSGEIGAEEYQAATFLPPSHLLTKGPLIEWSKDLAAATGGRVSFNVHSGGALLGANTMLQGLGDGVAQAGFVAASYYPRSFPKNNTIDDMSFVHTMSFPLAFAYTEFVMETPEILKEWTDNGLVFIAGMNTPPYQLFCRSDLQKPEDLKGKKIRTPGAVLTRWSQAVGAAPVNAPFSEAYIGLERGALDCVAADNTTLVSARLMEVTRYVIELDLGSYFLGSPWTLSKDFWTGLSIKDRQTVLDVTGRALVRLQITYAKNLDTAVSESKKAGVVFNPATPELKAINVRFIESDMGGSTKIIREQLGVENPDIYREQLNVLVEKWKGLLQGVDLLDENAVYALVKREIYDAVDVGTYGVD